MRPNHDFNSCQSPLKKLIPNVSLHLKRKENYPSEIPKHTPLNWFIRTQTPFTNKLILPQIIAIRDEQRTKRFIHRSQAEQLHLGCLICPASGDTSLSSTSYRLWLAEALQVRVISVYGVAPLGKYCCSKWATISRKLLMSLMLWFGRSLLRLLRGKINLDMDEIFILYF